MRMSQRNLIPADNAAPTKAGVLLLQRKCACGTHTPNGGECAQCKRKKLQRKSNEQLQGPDFRIPPIVHTALGGAGRPLDAPARVSMERHFGQDFSAVRVHTDAAAAQSARAVNALAYTVGRDVVFGAGQYAPSSSAGRRLLAHELTHVVQQRSGAATAEKLEQGAQHDAYEREADRNAAAIACSPVIGVAVQQRSAGVHLSRASASAPDAAALTRRLGQVPRSGLHFVPNTVTDTVVGPPEVHGGLLSAGAAQLNVIVGENQTLHRLATELLPLWLTATPFRPPGAAAPLPLDRVSADELARALLVFNQTYLPVPSMTRWRAGLRLPLPIRIDEATHAGVLHPLNIRALATGFDAAWLPLLDQHVAGSAAPPAATVRADATTFLAATPGALGRGIALGARALVNATAEQPFIREVFNQLGAGSFDVALQFMDNLVNREVDLLAAQTNGVAILTLIRTALAAGPATPTAAQSASLARANLMLGRVAGASATAVPVAMPPRAVKQVAIDTVKLDGSSRDPATDVALANGILAQCNVRLVHGANQTASAAQTAAWIGADRICTTGTCGAASAEERTLMTGATGTFGLTSRLRAFYVLNITSNARAESYPPYCATGGAAVIRNMIKVTNTASGKTLGHEVGHVLLNSGAHPAGTTNVMSPTNTAPLGEDFTNAQCTTLYNNA
jgi:hypothetical protein